MSRESGKELWAAKWSGGQSVNELARERGTWMRATPASDGERVFVPGMRDTLVCLDARDGAERWRVDFVKEYGAPLPMFGMASSPQVDGDVVYTLAAGGVVRVNAKTGKVEWRALTDDPKEEGGATSSVLVATVARQMMALSGRRSHYDRNPQSSEQATPAYRNTTTGTPVLVTRHFISMIAGRC